MLYTIIQTAHGNGGKWREMEGNWSYPIMNSIDGRFVTAIVKSTERMY